MIIIIYQKMSSGPPSKRLRQTVLSFNALSAGNYDTMRYDCTILTCAQKPSIELNLPHGCQKLRKLQTWGWDYHEVKTALQYL